MANIDIPFTRFCGRVKHLAVSEQSSSFDVFDVFFPRFRTEQDTSSFITRGRGRSFMGSVTMGGDVSVFTQRGRERRFAGDATLLRRQYYCVEDCSTNAPNNNSLLGEMFAYAEPRLPLQPSLLDSQVDKEECVQLAERLGWDLDRPYIFHIVEPRTDNWLFSPVLQVPPQGCVLRYPSTVVDMDIRLAVDLRLPSTQDWFFEIFVRMELEGEGRFLLDGGDTLSVAKSTPPANFVELVPTLLSPVLGGGTTFIQGIGAWLRAHGIQALIYPSARSNARAVVRGGQVVESYGYILVDFRDSPLKDFEARRYFGALPSWRERSTKSIRASRNVEGDAVCFEANGVRRLQEARFAVFNTWTKDSLDETRAKLAEGNRKLDDYVRLVVRRPSTILGPESQSILGSDEEFRNEEGGAATGFLAEWGGPGPFNTTAAFLCSLLPVVQCREWSACWNWDGVSWFLFRECLVRPWVVLKCPCCFSELFWNVSGGRPLPACPGCRFANGNSDRETSAAKFAKWANQFAGKDATWSDQENIRVYAMACEQYIDAVTGVQPPVQPKTFRVIEALSAGYGLGSFWFLMRPREFSTGKSDGNLFDIMCPQCGWSSISSDSGKGEIESTCPSCGFASRRSSGASDAARASRRAETLPDAFLQSVVQRIVTVMARFADIREAVGQIDPYSPEAADRYIQIFHSTTPSLPPLTAEHFMQIAERAQRMIEVKNSPSLKTVPVVEVFAELSRLLAKS